MLLQRKEESKKAIEMMIEELPEFYELQEEEEEEPEDEDESDAETEPGNIHKLVMMAYSELEWDREQDRDQYYVELFTLTVGMEPGSDLDYCTIQHKFTR